MAPSWSNAGLSGRLGLRLLSIASLFLIWWIGTLSLGERLCPDPFTVLSFAGREIMSGELAYQLAITLSRVAAAFLLAMAVGTALGLAMGRNAVVNALGEPWLILLLNAPALIIIVLAYIWIGLTEVAAVLAVALNKIPNVTVTIREGTKALDSGLIEMARVYRFGRGRMLRHVILPQLYPYIWKIVLVVELLGRSNGIGFKIHLYFQVFDVRAIPAYTIVFAGIMLAIEFIVVQPIEKRAYRWRPQPA
jgi:NitT/TauT family transport system permease protein